MKLQQMDILPVLMRLASLSFVTIAISTYLVHSRFINYHHFDEDMRKNAYHVVTPYGVLQCGKLCALEGRCVSINYHIGNLICELVQISAAVHTDVAGWVSTSNFSFVMDKLGSCKNVTNQEIDVCVPVTNGGQVSMKKFCPALTGSQYANVTSDVRVIGATIENACIESLCILDSSITCLPNGLWSGDCTVVPENSLQLLNGTSKYNGRVRICHNGIWGTVCDHGWNTPDAAVVCRQLGYSGGQASLNWPSEGQIWLHLVYCSGSESALANCPSDGWTNSHCDNQNDDGAGVSCNP